MKSSEEGIGDRGKEVSGGGKEGGVRDVNTIAVHSRMHISTMENVDPPSNDIIVTSAQLAMPSSKQEILLHVVS